MKSEILTACRDWFKAQGITQGFTQEQQTALVMHLLKETVFTEMSAQEFKDGFALLYPLMNASAFRQKMEEAGVLAKSEGKKRGADASALASKWAATLAATDEKATPEAPKA